MTNSLGRLIRVDPREVWASEPHGFTPWLSENLALLSEALGVEMIELTQTEMPVGEFALDIFAQEARSSGRRVIIENQLAAADHGHLGQLLTYAAGLDAGIVVWISPRIRDEYRQAITWLNTKTTDDLSFFGVEVELLRIDDSRPAPNFRVVAQPSDFQRQVTKSVTEKSPRRVAYHDFFDDLLTRLKAQSPNFTSATRAPYESWMSFSGGRTGFGINPGFASGNRFRVEVYIDTGNKEANKSAFDQLLAMRTEIESIVESDSPWEWDRLDNRQACRIAVVKEGSIDSPPAVLDELKTWAVTNLVAFRTVFAPRLSALKLTADSEIAVEEPAE